MVTHLLTYQKNMDLRYYQFCNIIFNYLAHAWRYFSLVAIPPRMCLSCLLTSRTFLASLASSGLISISLVVTSLCAVLLLTYFGCLSYSGFMLNYVICQLGGAFFNIVSHIGTPEVSFIQSMPGKGVLC